MKKTNLLFSLLLILGSFLIQSQLFAMKKGTMVIKDTRSQNARARLQQKIKVKQEELEKQQQEAVMLFYEEKLVNSAEQCYKINEKLEKTDAEMINAFGNGDDVTVSMFEKKNTKMQHPVFKKNFSLKNAEQIAFLLQFPGKIERKFLLKNPEFIQQLLERPEPEIKEMGKLALAIRENAICQKEFKDKCETFFVDLRFKMEEIRLHDQSIDKNRHFVQLLDLTEKYKKHLKTCSTVEATKEDKEYWQNIKQSVEKYKKSFSTINALYENIIKKIKSAGGILTWKSEEITIELPDSLQPSLSIKKPEIIKIPSKQQTHKQKLKSPKSKKPKCNSKNIKPNKSTPQHQQKPTTTVTKREKNTITDNDIMQKKTEVLVTAQEKSVTIEKPTIKQKANQEGIKQSEKNKVSKNTENSCKTITIPPSIIPKLPTLDNSQFIGDLDNPLYVIINHPKIGKYLFYKPTESSPVSLETPEFCYHERVQKYIQNSDQALVQDGFTKKCGVATLAKIKALKAFPHAADWLFKSLGVKDTFIDKRKRIIPRFTLMGQVQQKNENAKPIHGVFQWGFFPRTKTKTCYHRSGTEKVPETMIEEYHKRQFEVEFPALPDDGNSDGKNGKEKK